MASKADKPVTSDGLVAAVSAERVVDEAPNLPTAEVAPDAPAPTIDTNLLALRDAEAKSQADRFAASQKK